MDRPLLEMLEVAVVGSCIGSQVAVKFATTLSMWSCGSTSQMVCKATQLVNHLGLWLEFMVLFQHGALHVIVKCSNLEGLGH